MRVSWLFPAVQTAASRPTKPKKEGERKAEKSMHLINKQKRKQKKKCTTNAGKKTEKKKKSVLQIQKSMQKEPGRAGGQRPAAWPGGNNKKYAPKSAGKTCCRPAFTAAADKVCTRTKKKGQKKAEKMG